MASAHALHLPGSCSLFTSWCMREAGPGWLQGQGRGSQLASWAPASFGEPDWQPCPGFLGVCLLVQSQSHVREETTAVLKAGQLSTNGSCHSFASQGSNPESRVLESHLYKEQTPQ